MQFALCFTHSLPPSEGVFVVVSLRIRMITAISWVPKGASKEKPSKAEPPSEDEIKDSITAATSSGGECEDNEEEESDDEHMDDANALEELDMANYDKEKGFDLFSLWDGNRYYESNDLDPYLKDNVDDDDSEELEDMTIKPTDSVIACASSDDGFSGLIQVYILRNASSTEMELINFPYYVIIPSFPLCTAWLDCCRKGERGSFLAVGSMEPSIEIWDLDVRDAVQPCVVLGGTSDKNKNGKKKSIKNIHDSHTESVLGLAWNKKRRNILASASADKRVKIWDLVVGKCGITMEHHSDKVQAVAWNHHEPHVLLSGSFDRTVALKDERMPSHSGYRWSVTADVESLAWDPHTEHSFVVSLEDGIVKCFDVRTAKSDSTSDSSATFTLHAHDKAVTTVSYNLSAPNLIATGSMDKTVKLWDLSNNQPSCVASRTKAGAVFSVSFSEDNPFLLAIAGSEGNLDLEVWDTLSESGISRRYENYNKNRTQRGS